MLSRIRAFAALRRRWFYWIGGLAAIYTVFGFLLLPLILRRQLESRLGALLHRPVSVLKVRCNPYSVAVTVEGMEVKDRDGGPFLGWERLHVDLALWATAFHHEVAFQDFTLQQFHGRVALFKDGGLNFSDILKSFQGGPPSPSTPEGEHRELRIDRLRVEGARVSFQDLSREAPFETVVGPLNIALDAFRTERDAKSPYSFQGRTESGERFGWKGSVSVDPLKSSGTLSLESLQLPKYAPYYQDLVGFELKEGRATVQADYEFEWTEARHRALLADASLLLQSLKLAEPSRPDPALDLPDLRAGGIHWDFLENEVRVARIAAEGGRIRLGRTKDGALNLGGPFWSKGPKKPEDPAAKPFKLSLNAVALHGLALDFEDRSPSAPVRVSLDPLDLELDGFTLDPSQATKATLDARMGKGRLQAEGTLQLLRTAGDLKVRAEGLDLAPFDPYLAPFADARLNRGTLGLDGRATFAFEGRATDHVEYTGGARLSNLEAMDLRDREPFIRWKLLRFDGLDYRSDRAALKLKAADWTAPEGRLVIAADGTTNVARALRLAQPTSPTGAVLAPTPVAPSGKAAFALAVGRIGIQQGRLSFIDRSVEPSAALLLSDLEGRYLGLSTDPDAQSDIQIHGKAGGLAPLSIQGLTMPLRQDLDTDAKLLLDGAELTDFGPYAMKYLGWTIQKGKLDVDAKVRIQQRKLDAQVLAKLDQFYLGEKVQSPDATHLPVKLALAILRDRKGVIDIDLPIEGSLDDPQFRVGRIIWHAIGNLLTKIVASPFTLLAKAFGGGSEDLSAVDFPPGSAEPSPEARKKAEILAKSLNGRPELKMEVEGAADPGADGRFFKRQRVERLLRELKAKAKKADPETVTVEAGEREKWLGAAFEAAFPAPKGSKAALPPPAEMEQRIVDAQPLDTDALAELADRRAKAMVGLLLAGGQVEPDRVFQTRGTLEGDKKATAKVHFTLR
ncbi:MAG TPA: DUF748 domain-containing protein [Holophagaceae bacterium]|nr:DUF748 domain-containing protein [Holophagaceae bacterium]